MSDKLRRRRIRRQLARKREGIDWGPMPKLKKGEQPEPPARAYDELTQPPEESDELA